MKHHELKIWTQYFDHVLSGRKTFEVRKNDRDFKEGDIVTLREWNNLSHEYTGQYTQYEIGYILPIDSQYVVFSLLQVTK